MDIKAINQRRHELAKELVAIANELDAMLDVVRADDLTMIAHELQNEEYVPKLPNQAADKNKQTRRVEAEFELDEDEIDEEEEYRNYVYGDDDEDVDFDMRNQGRKVEVEELDSIAQFAQRLKESGVKSPTSHNGIQFASDPMEQFMKLRAQKDGGVRSVDKGGGYEEMHKRIAMRQEREARKAGLVTESRPATQEDILFEKIIQAREVHATLIAKEKRGKLSENDDIKYAKVVQFLRANDPMFFGL